MDSRGTETFKLYVKQCNLQCFYKVLMPPCNLFHQEPNCVPNMSKHLKY